MDTALKALLETRAASVNDIAETLGKSPTWVRTQLKRHDDLVCEAPSALNPRMTIYYLPVPLEPSDEPLEDAMDFGTAVLGEDPAHEIDETRCRFCASANISAAGEIGTFLGAATVCGDCGKTYNTFSGEENHAVILSEELVRELRRLRADGLSYQQLADRYEIDKKHAWRICQRIAWSWLD